VQAKGGEELDVISKAGILVIYQWIDASHLIDRNTYIGAEFGYFNLDLDRILTTSLHCKEGET